MADPALSAEHPLTVAISAAAAVAVTIAGGIASALRLSGRIAAAESDAAAAKQRLEEAEKSIGRLADENKALRAELGDLRGDVAELQSAAERGKKNQASVRRLIADIKGSLAREGR